MGKIKAEAWALTSADTTSIPSGNRADATASKWSDIWKYQVPSGQAHILQPSHRFSVYLDTSTGSSEIAATAQVRIEIRDQSENDHKVIFGPVMYVQCKEMQDVRKIATLSLQKDMPVDEKFYIVILVNYSTAAVEAYCYFKLDTIRIRSTL